MTKIICANTVCKHLDDSDYCDLKEIKLSWHSVVTKHDGRQEFLRCNNYEESDEAKKIRESFESLII